MKVRRPSRPQVECLESRALLSTGAEVLSGTLDGTFFAHKGSARTGTLFSLFASGRVEPAGGTLLVGGFETAGFTARGAGGGNLILALKTRPGDIHLRVTERAKPAAESTGTYLFRYQITGSPGNSPRLTGSGTLAVTLDPINTNLQGKPVSNPGFFGNATLHFS